MSDKLQLVVVAIQRACCEAQALKHIGHLSSWFLPYDPGCFLPQLLASEQ